jgi:hypothetical protein
LNELRGCWLVGVTLAVLLFIASFAITGFSWDSVTVGIVLIGLAFIAFAWYRRFPRG